MQWVYNLKILIMDDVMQRKACLAISTLALTLTLLSGCTYNPFMDNHLTGSVTSTAVGAGAGVGAVALFRGSPTALVIGGLTGGAIGYYTSTLRFSSGGLIQSGGQVYKIGDFIGIYIPSDKIFVVNTADFNYRATRILDSVVSILNRYPNNNIIISGNTSGFGRPRYERQLSLRRAQRISAYLWSQGITQFKEGATDASMRQLNYTGYGNYFPIANDDTNNNIRENSRIQITSYPTDCNLHLDKRHAAVYNIGAEDDSFIDKAVDSKQCNGDANCYDGEG